MSWLLIVVLAFYSFLILLLFFGDLKLRKFEIAALKAEKRFSVCIPFRDEAENLGVLLRSLAQLDYPKTHFEIILVNDGSTDHSAGIIENFVKKSSKTLPNLNVIDNIRVSGSPKKDALDRAIKSAKHDWIVTTDADCKVPPDWLRLFNTYILRTKKSFVAAPVAYYTDRSSFLNVFQQLDFLSLQGATMGGFGLNKPFMCNGANIAFAKADFLRLNGYDGNKTIASGDDVFLMQKFLKADTTSAGYIKSRKAIVLTRSQQSWKQLLNQRKRWAAKAGSYKNSFSQGVSWVVLLGNLTFILAVFYSVKSPVLIFFLISKIAVDFVLIAQAALFFKKKKNLWGYVLSMLFYPFFVVYVAVLSQLGGYHWKGREFRK